MFLRESFLAGGRRSDLGELLSAVTGSAGQVAVREKPILQFGRGAFAGHQIHHLGVVESARQMRREDVHVRLGEDSADELRRDDLAHEGDAEVIAVLLTVELPDRHRSGGRGADGLHDPEPRAIARLLGLGRFHAHPGDPAGLGVALAFGRDALHRDESLVRVVERQRPLHGSRGRNSGTQDLAERDGTAEIRHVTLELGLEPIHVVGVPVPLLIEDTLHARGCHLVAGVQGVQHPGRDVREVGLHDLASQEVAGLHGAGEHHAARQRRAATEAGADLSE